MVRGTKFNLMAEVIINEVGPRDGLQNIETILSVNEDSLDFSGCPK